MRLVVFKKKVYWRSPPPPPEFHWLSVRRGHIYNISLSDYHFMMSHLCWPSFISVKSLVWFWFLCWAGAQGVEHAKHGFYHWPTPQSFSIAMLSRPTSNLWLLCLASWVAGTVGTYHHIWLLMVLHLGPKHTYWDGVYAVLSFDLFLLPSFLLLMLSSLLCSHTWYLHLFFYSIK